MLQNVTLAVRDSVAAANGRDLPKYLDAANVRTMTVGRSAERGKPLLRQGQTRERGTRKAKIEAKLERRRTMADQDLRRQPPEAGQKRKPIPAMRMNSVNRGCRDMTGVIGPRLEGAEVSDDTAIADDEQRMLMGFMILGAVYSSEQMLEKHPQNRHFRHFGGPSARFAGETARSASCCGITRSDTISGGLGPPKTDCVWVHRKRHINFHRLYTISRDSEWHQRQIDCAEKNLKLLVSRPRAETSIDTWPKAALKSRHHGAY
jgi:hypothetical protein